MSSEPGDDVHRLFACFKCGTSTPQSALKEGRTLPEKPRRSSLADAKAPVSSQTARSGSAPQDEDTTRTPMNRASRSLAAKFGTGKQISPIVFYGSPHGAPVKRPSQLLRLLREIRIDLSEHIEVLSRKEVWATFPRQEDAFRFSETHGHVNIFCYQDHFSGQRRFLVSTYEEFWKRYEVMESKLRHHYEVIREGCPCHLYFDLEFDKRVNTSRNPDEMVDVLISLTFNVLFDKYAICGNPEWVMELDSSTEEKFSRHLIIQIPNTAFQDNLHVGAFVSEVSSTAARLHGSNTQLEKIYIRKDSGCPTSEAQLFLDSAVYSRNRCFRLFLSSKAGKSSILLPTGRFACSTLNEKQIFMKSLICKVDVDLKKLLVCKMDLDCKKILSFDSEVHMHNLNMPSDITLRSRLGDVSNSYLFGRSPFAALDEFIEYIASSGNALGKIRSWYWFSDYGLMVYSMLRNRYCERIGREHKSNHVMYIVDFQRAGYYQKCYDPDCRGYRSPLRPVPWDVMPGDMAVQNVVQTAENNGPVNIDINLQDNADMSSNDLCDDSLKLVDSCTKDKGWWQQVIGYADSIENIGNIPDLPRLDETWFEDDADNCVSEADGTRI